MKPTDIQNTLYGVMHSDMVPVVAPFVPTIEVGGGSSLLDQIERAYGLPALQLHSMEAARFLASCVDKTPSEIEKLVTNLSKLALVQNVDTKDPQGMMFAVAAAAVMETGRRRDQTAMEKLEGALALLSARYQADW